MTEQPPAEEHAEPPVIESEEDYGLSAELIHAIEDALETGHGDVVLELATKLHEADLADLLESLTHDERRQMIEVLGGAFDPEVLPYLDAAVREEVIDQLGPQRLARLLSALHSDDAVEVFEDLDEAFQHRILTALPQAYRHLLEESLS